MNDATTTHFLDEGLPRLIHETVDNTVLLLVSNNGYASTTHSLAEGFLAKLATAPVLNTFYRAAVASVTDNALITHCVAEGFSMQSHVADSESCLSVTRWASEELSDMTFSLRFKPTSAGFYLFEERNDDFFDGSDLSFDDDE